MTFKEITNELDSYGVENPRDEALIIIEHITGLSPAKIMLDMQKSYTDPAIFEILEKRREHFPLQYILGKWEFMGKEFFVSPDCLIPRPDTEILVEKAIELTKDGADVCDLCTGSGCIGISIALSKRVNLTLLDISSGALNMARKNAQAHNVNADFVLGDLRYDIPNKQFDIITVNPPYIPREVIKTLSEEVKKEPSLALDGGEDGLDLIRHLLEKTVCSLKVGGKMLIEFGYDQEAPIVELLNSYGLTSYEILYDYGKNPRVLIIYK